MGKMIRATAKLALVPALTAALCGCQQAKTYPLAHDAAEAALVGSEIPAIAFGMAAHSAPGEPTAGGVEWRVYPGPGAPYGGQATGAASMLLTAHLTFTSGGTQVEVDIAAADPAKNDIFASAMAAKPAIADMFRAIGREQVDARLSQRDFHLANIQASMAAATVSMLPEIGKAMDRDADEFQRRDQENIDNAYKAASKGGATPPQSGTQAAPSNPWR